MELLPLKATFAPDEPIAVEIRGANAPVVVTLRHLGRTVAERRGASSVRFPPQAEGGYGVDAGAAASAVDVLADPLRRPRYGFLSEFPAGRDPTAAVDHVRRLHLNAVQLYDWMYRHARLLPPRDRYDDPLGRPLSLATVRRLARALTRAGSLPLAYAAVYATGREERGRWADAALLQDDGSQWALGEDFLWLLDPADARWSRYLATELRAAADAVGVAGFHLDQYGWPKRALRPDGREVDLAAAFPELLRRLRRALPHSRLVFNNVNAFPLWSTAPAPQDAVYVEVWPPHDGLDHLAGLIREARLRAPEKGAILAAYLSVFAHAPEPEALEAARLAMATIFSHGGSHLLLGEEGAALTDPYYPRHHRLGRWARAAFTRWYDFAVRYGDVLYDPEAVDVTRTVLGGINDEVRIEAPVPVTTDPIPGALWARVVETAAGRVVHLVDLTRAADLRWDAPRRPGLAPAGVRIYARRATAAGFASPETAPALRPLRSPSAPLPRFRSWALVLLS